MIWQPTLTGKLLRARPLREDDFETLYAAAADPLIWEVHPEPDRYQRPVFAKFFRSGMDCNGALLIEDAQGVIGSSRFCNTTPSFVEIGYTFLVRRCWGGAYNHELKTLMMAHAFKHVPQCIFVVGRNNHRSRAAMVKIGGVLVDPSTIGPRDVDPQASVVYRISHG